MADARADEIAGDAAPRDCTVHSASIENVFVILDAFAANFGSFFVNFVGILRLYDTRNAIRRSQCEYCAASERQNMHFHFANNRSFLFHFAAMSSVVRTGFQSSWSLLHRLDIDTGIHVCLTANHLHRMQCAACPAQERKKMILFISI